MIYPHSHKAQQKMESGDWSFAFLQPSRGYWRLTDHRFPWFDDLASTVRLFRVLGFASSSLAVIDLYCSPLRTTWFDRSSLIWENREQCQCQVAAKSTAMP